MPLQSDPIRLGLIGCGYVSKYHLAASAAVGVPILAVCDSKPAAADAVAARCGARVFPDAAALTKSGAVDAVIIATPHLLHVSLAIAALDHGLHVLCEKPLAVTAAEADEAIAAHARRPDLAFAVNFNHRAWPLWRSIKSAIDDGTLGPIVRYQWTITDWYRTQWYFDQSAWRGTWAGEGGGLLVNQCPHQLDMLAHLFGQPLRVTATLRIGKHHDIAVEDEVHAILDHPGGATGCFIASTGEPCGSNRLDIIGDKGTIRVTDENGYDLMTFATSASIHTRAIHDRAAPPAQVTRRITTGPHEDEYRDVLANFLAACGGIASPLASATQAKASIEIANAILLAGDTGQSVTLPADRNGVGALLERYRARERSAATLKEGS